MEDHPARTSSSLRESVCITSIVRSITVMNPKLSQTVVATTNLMIKSTAGGIAPRVKIEPSNGLGGRGHGHGHATRLEI